MNSCVVSEGTKTEDLLLKQLDDNEKIKLLMLVLESSDEMAISSLLDH